MEATTIRASTVIRSIPTSDTRTQASMTMPLSSTRSRTSIRLVPPAARSTGIGQLLRVELQSVAALPWRRRGSPTRQRRQPSLEPTHLFPQFIVFRRQRLLAGRQVVIVLPPIEANLLGLIDRADEQTNPDRQKLDFRQRHFDVAGDHKPLVQDAVEDVDEPGGSPLSLSQ